ncbi:cytochrome P450 [Mycena maculata]|uniref:Cytochrome P450 n=1 Tax=Mycena maculata TaxID=230809 RepID=A0AAD7IZK5_9AGAR|nr:cytochrome P450 [Mycena maculata]
MFSDHLPSSLFFRLSLVPVVLLVPLVLFFGFLFSLASLKAHSEHVHVPSEVPWVGKRRELLGSIRANWRGLVKSMPLYLEGYGKYSKANLVHVVPTWQRGPQIILPPSMAPWLAQMPTEVLHAKNCTFYNCQFKHTVGHPEITSNDMIDLLIKRELTRTTGTMNVELLEEIELSMSSLYGSDGQWKKVGVYDTAGKIVGRVANRVFVGKELCSNMEYVQSGSQFANAVGVSAIILHFFPKFMRPAVGWFATMPNRRCAGVALKYLKPLIAQRIVDMKTKAADPTYTWEEPNDFITWMVRESFKRNTEDETSVYSLAYRIVVLNFGAISTTTITVTNAILDIWSSPASQNVVSILREEAERVFAEHNGEWTKAAVGKLYRLDSAIRESSRVSAIGGVSLARRTKTDVTLPNGLVVKKDNCIGVSMDGIHFDEEYYPRAREFDAFRFSRPREEATLDEKPPVNEDLVTTSAHYLPFSHGLHACPGRFFAANNVKMILAHILINYEIQPFTPRPSNVTFGDMSVVPTSAEMLIRRRVKA